MHRKDRERDEAFAWEVLKKAPYATLAMTGADGAPYCVPINHVADETYRVLYLHCAGAGEKWALLEKEPQVCLTAVSRMSIVPNEFETSYDSAVVRGQAQVVTDEGERTKALLLLVEALDPKGMGGLAACMANRWFSARLAAFSSRRASAAAKNACTSASSVRNATIPKPTQPAGRMR